METKELGKIKLVPYYNAKYSGMYKWDFQGFEECDQFHRAAINEKDEVLFVAKYKDVSYEEVESIFVVEKIPNGDLRIHIDNFNSGFIIIDRGGYAKTLEEEISKEIEYLEKKKKQIQEMSWE